MRNFVEFTTREKKENIIIMHLIFMLYLQYNYIHTLFLVYKLHAMGLF